MQFENEIPVPTAEELIQALDETASEAERHEQFLAALIASTSLLIGVLGNLLFHRNPVGINVFFYLALFSLAAFGLLIYMRRPIVRKHAVFVVPAAGFALLLGVRLAPQLIVFNAFAMVGSLLLVIHFTGTSRFIGGHWFKPLQYAVESLMLGWLESLSRVVPNSLRYLGRAKLDNDQLTNLRSVLRGIVITLPVVAVFTLLLSSADAVFGDFAKLTLSFVLPESVSSALSQLVFITLFTLIALTAFWTMLRDQPEVSEEPAPHTRSQRFRLNLIESSMVLGSVNCLFVAFVIIQARYFFGGEANITAQGYTYAEYARRGFYELLAVSCMTMLLLVAAESLTHRKREEENLFRSLVILMVILTFVILIAAFRRLKLYENAYGYTRIRVMSGTFMIWLAVLLGVLLIAILRHRREVFWAGCIVTSFAFILTLNLMNMDGFIAHHNIARFEDTGKLDVDYLLSLSDDAMPIVAILIDSRDLGTTERERLLHGLGSRLHKLDQDREERGVFSYHLGKDRAWHALDDHRKILRPYLYASAR